MLENFLNSKLKNELLGILFAHPERSFSIVELRAMTGTSMPRLRETLREFRSGDVVDTAARAQIRFFRINRHFALYDELMDLVKGPEPKVRDEIGKAIKRIPNLKLAVLSGVFTLQPRLPVDLLLVIEKPNQLLLGRHLSKMEKIVGCNLNYCALDPEEYQERRMMNDRLVRDVFDFPHIVVITNLKKR